jgi:Ca-activated chloride channel family protein
MESLADRGNGNYHYVDSLAEARKVLVTEGGGTLVTVAKDVKIQVEFNPLRIEGYRLIGYENRVMANRDFADDRKDAGEVGAGHSVTALYEVIPAGGAVPAPGVDELRYQRDKHPTKAAQSGEALTVRLRWKSPQGKTSRLAEFPVRDTDSRLHETSDDFRFAAAVAAWGMILRRSDQVTGFGLSDVERLARAASDEDPGGYRAEFLELVRTSGRLSLPR